MSDSIISSLTELTSIATDDEFVIVDKSDTSMAVSGTTKKVKTSSIIDTDGTLSGNLDSKVASQKATKTYADTKLSISSKATAVQAAAGTDDTNYLTSLSAASHMNYGLSRQAIMNGNFDVWQRGTSVALSDVTSIYQADRWFDYINKDGGTLPTLTRSRQLLTSGDITNAYYFTRLTTNGAGTSLGSSSYGVLLEKIENGTSKLCGLNKKVTVSFYARSSITNKRICPTISQGYGTGGSPTAQEEILGTPITLTSSWTKYTATFTTNTIVGKSFGSNDNDYLTVNFWYEWGTTFGNTYVQTGVSAETYVGAGNIDIAQVQLCSGDVALPFNPKSYEEELRACQRYYETGTHLVQTYATSGSRYGQPIQFHVKKCGSPTVVQTNTAVDTFSTSTLQTNVTVDGFTSQRDATGTGASKYWAESWTALSEI